MIRRAVAKALAGVSGESVGTPESRRDLLDVMVCEAPVTVIRFDSHHLTQMPVRTALTDK